MSLCCRSVRNITRCQAMQDYARLCKTISNANASDFDMFDPSLRSNCGRGGRGASKPRKFLSAGNDKYTYTILNHDRNRLTWLTCLTGSPGFSFALSHIHNSQQLKFCTGAISMAACQISQAARRNTPRHPLSDHTLDFSGATAG